MKKILTVIAIAVFVASCNDAKDPPDDGVLKPFVQIQDSVIGVDTLPSTIYLRATDSE